MSDKTFLGAGMKFPPQIDMSTGRFAVAKKEISVKESVYLILMTHRGERFLRPSFGSQIMDYTFMDTSVTMLSIMQREIEETILRQEPRIGNVQVELQQSNQRDCYIFDIKYTVAEDNRADNLVFPFFLKGDGGEQD
ncbi:GPW/gp25 family protein [Bengtsoniella intestinalis]|uniref:GPW/gp25 family protein n=1 Tax=Bengtsoniella intestinalis TaxID=3073143 RepID=UPI00391F9A6E